MSAHFSSSWKILGSHFSNVNYYLASPRLWRIPKDLEPERRKGKKIKCMNCNNYGYHVAATCPEPRRKIVCVMCGNTGHKTGCMYTNDRNWPKNRPRVVHTSCKRTLCLNVSCFALVAGLLYNSGCNFNSLNYLVWTDADTWTGKCIFTDM